MNSICVKPPGSKYKSRKSAKKFMRGDHSWNKDGVLAEHTEEIYVAIKFKSFYNYTKITLGKINVGTKGL